MDDLEKSIREMRNQITPLDRDEVAYLLLRLLDRIQKLEAAALEGSEGK